MEEEVAGLQDLLKELASSQKSQADDMKEQRAMHTELLKALATPRAGTSAAASPPGSSDRRRKTARGSASSSSPFGNDVAGAGALFADGDEEPGAEGDPAHIPLPESSDEDEGLVNDTEMGNLLNGGPMPGPAGAPAAAPAAASPAPAPVAGVGPNRPAHEDQVRNFEIAVGLTDAKLQPFKMVSPSHQIAWVDGAPMAQAFNWMAATNPLNPAGQGFSYTPNQMNGFASNFLKADFDLALGDTIDKVLQPVRNYASPNKRLLKVLETYGCFLVGAQTFKRTVLSVCLCIAKNHRLAQANTPGRIVE